MVPINEKELEIYTEAADAVYQRPENRYYDVKKEKVERKHIIDKKINIREDENTKKENAALIEKVDYIKLYNSNDNEIGNDKYYKPKAITGFKYAVYRKKNNKDEIILAYAGTDRYNLLSFFNDVRNDMELPIVPPEQFDEALSAYNSVRTHHKTEKITITGHSLGGALAQYVGAITGEKTITFNTYGVKKSFERFAKKHNINLSKSYDNIINYKAENDILYKLAEGYNSKNNIGITYVVEGGPKGEIDAHEMLYYILKNPKIPAKIWENTRKRKSDTKQDYSVDTIDRKTDVPQRSIEHNAYKDKTNPIWNKTLDELLHDMKIKNEGYNSSSFLLNLNRIQSNQIFKTLLSIKKSNKLFEKYTRMSYFNKLAELNKKTNIVDIDKDTLPSPMNNFGVPQKAIKELIQSAQKSIRDREIREREEIINECTKRVLGTIQQCMENAHRKYEQQEEQKRRAKFVLTDERFNQICSYISEKLREAAKEKSVAWMGYYSKEQRKNLGI